MSKIPSKSCEDMARWRPTPEKILQAVQQAEAGVASLQGIANQKQLARKFTLDGRLVGDIGELLLCDEFDVIPDRKPNGHAHDMVGRSELAEIQVQVKLRRMTRSGGIEFKYQPECLVVIEMEKNWETWRIVYNGPGDVVRGDGIQVEPDTRRLMQGKERAVIALSLKALTEAAAQASENTLKLEPKSIPAS